MNASDPRRRPRPRRRILLLSLLTLAVVAAGSLDTSAVAGSLDMNAVAGAPRAQQRHTPTGPALAAAARTQRRCVLRVNVHGVLQPVTHSAWQYRYVRLHGKVRRVVRRVRVPRYVNCSPPPCVQQHRVRGKLVPVLHRVSDRVLVPRHGKLVRVRRSVWRYAVVACPKPLGTPATLKVVRGSTATLDFTAFNRQAPVSGAIHGYFVGGFRPKAANQLILTSQNMTLARTPVFIDNVCHNRVTAAIRTGSPATITLDQTRQSTVTISPGGRITSVVYVVIHLPLELRNGDDGCQKRYLTTGYDSERIPLFLTGRLTGLKGVRLRSAPELVEFGGCLGLGSPKRPCSGFSVPLDTQVSVNLRVDITVGR